MIRTFLAVSAGLCTHLATSAVAQPSLILTEDGVTAIQAAADARYPLFERAKTEAMDRVQRSMSEGVVVPTPVDPGGGYTHERHKENYKIIHDAGMLYQITGKKKYLKQAEKILHTYAEIYDDLPLHPARKNQAPGRLFWQSLNEAVWLVYSIQGYDAIRDDLSAESRAKIETGVLRPMATFLSVGSPETFRKIHNHGTWAAAAVGMTGYALDDQAMVDRALDGLDGDRSSGFLAQLTQLFSPDGYYTEGPYYQRYALMPFVLFAQAVQNNEPSRGIFTFRDEILLKAIDATVQQSYGGKFFPINDAIKEKGLDTVELVYGVAAAYAQTGDKRLLSIAEGQGTTVLTGDGLAVAQSVAEGRAKPFGYATQILSDGPLGEQGGLVVLRKGDTEDAQTLVAKHTGQGMGHGHFDKLALILYDGGEEILTDYGAARFLNVPSKEGGRYLPENTSWAKQSIAHNTAVVNQTSHFDGDWRRAQKSWPTITFFEEGKHANVVSARIDDAYDGASLSRTTLQLDIDDSGAPVIVDVMTVDVQAPSSVDLPFYFQGHLTDSDVSFTRYDQNQSVLGDKNGYQHLWREADAGDLAAYQKVTWLTKGRFYSYHMIPPAGADLSIVRTGANDPDFNLRSQQGVVLQAKTADKARFVSVIEPHGLYDPAAEFTMGSESRIAQVGMVPKGDALLVTLTLQDGKSVRVALSDPAKPKQKTKITTDGKTWSWSGAYKIFKE